MQKYETATTNKQTNSWNGNLLTTFEEHGAFVPSFGCMEISRSLARVLRTGRGRVPASWLTRVFFYMTQ